VGLAIWNASPGRGERDRVTKNLSPLPGLATQAIFPRLAPWATICRTSGAEFSILEFGFGSFLLDDNPMKTPHFLTALLLGAISLTAFGQNQSASNTPVSAAIPPRTAQAHADEAVTKKAGDWVASLSLADAAKAARVQEVIATHLKTIRDWHNEHPYTTVPAGINPVTGKPLSHLDRQIIANSAMPKSVHENLMSGLRQDLTAEQVEAILDKYTVGKVAFTLAGYHSIVPDLTKAEEETIRSFLKQAREEAVDYKNMNQISAIFEIYKTKSEQYLNANGRSWKALYKTYTDAVKAKKSGTNQPPVKP
jgi:hypothetical protein